MGLLTSCAMPAASSPTAARRPAVTSRRRSSTTSRMIPYHPDRADLGAFRVAQAGDRERDGDRLPVWIRQQGLVLRRSPPAAALPGIRSRAPWASRSVSSSRLEAAEAHERLVGCADPAILTDQRNAVLEGIQYLPREGTRRRNILGPAQGKDPEHPARGGEAERAELGCGDSPRRAARTRFPRSSSRTEVPRTAITYSRVRSR